MQAKPKVLGRGVSSARGTSKLKFSHEMAKQNGLFITRIESVEVATIKIGEETQGMPSFNGLEIPKLAITFSSFEEDANKRRYVHLNFLPVESNVDTIPSGKSAWKVNIIFDWMKHILDVLVLKGRDLSDDEAAALALPYLDFDDSGNYVAVEPETVIAGWKQLFENFANMLNHGNNGKPLYVKDDGKPVSLWTKLVRYVRNKDGKWKALNNGDLAFPSFVGEGCLEVCVANQAPSILRYDAVRENIRPMTLEKPKAPNVGTGIPPMMPAMDTMMPQGGSSMMPNYSEIASAAADDLPFD